MKRLNIAGLQKFSTVDYPGMFACVVFLKGCPNNCPYCYNKELISTEPNYSIVWSDIINFLKNKVDKLDAVVFSGGEPLLQDNVIECMKEVKELGFKVGLHTSGYNPALLFRCLRYVDWVGLDAKTDLLKYHCITGLESSAENFIKSLDLLLDNKMKFECRTTYCSKFISDEDLVNLAKYLNSKNVKYYWLQRCIINNAVQPIKTDLLDKVRAVFPNIRVRSID